MYSLEHSQDLSPTAVICENLQRFGGTPQKGEPDPRAVWDRDEALAGLESILDTFVDEIAPDGTQLADERESLLWGFVNTLHMQTVRLDRAVDRLAPELKQLQRSQDGTEINAWELERIIERARNLGDRRDAFEQLRDAAAERYRADTGSTWRPRHGSHTSRTVATHLRGYRCPGLPPRPRERENPGAPAARHPRRRHRLQARRERSVDLLRARSRPRQVQRHGPGARRRSGCGKDSGSLGRVEGHPPGRVQAGLERPRTGRAVPEKRPTAEPAAEGCARVPRFRGHREPRRQGHPARHSRQASSAI